MTDNDLVERLRHQWRQNDIFNDFCGEAAEIIEQLQAENARLTAKCEVIGRLLESAGFPAHGAPLEERVERLTATFAAANEDAERLVRSAMEGTVGDWDKALAAHRARITQTGDDQ